MILDASLGLVVRHDEAEGERCPVRCAPTVIRPRCGPAPPDCAGSPPRMVPFLQVLGRLRRCVNAVQGGQTKGKRSHLREGVLVCPQITTPVWTPSW